MHVGPNPAGDRKLPFAARVGYHLRLRPRDAKKILECTVRHHRPDRRMVRRVSHRRSKPFFRCRSLSLDRSTVDDGRDFYEPRMGIRYLGGPFAWSLAWRPRLAYCL